jgi:hypothetical protein
LKLEKREYGIMTEDLRKITSIWLNVPLLQWPVCVAGRRDRTKTPVLIVCIVCVTG